MSSINDFDFLFGRWTVRHLRLRERGCGCRDWDELGGSAETRPLLGGLCNVEEHVIPDGHFSGVALRAFDRGSSLWSIYWVSDRDGVLQPPVTGGFAGDIGRFEGSDVADGRPVRVRFLWDRSDAGVPKWSQSFSYDDGRSWELNWVMNFSRAS